MVYKIVNKDIDEGTLIGVGLRECNSGVEPFLETTKTLKNASVYNYVLVWHVHLRFILKLCNNPIYKSNNSSLVGSPFLPPGLTLVLS